MLKLVREYPCELEKDVLHLSKSVSGGGRFADEVKLRGAVYTEEQMSFR